MQLTGEDATAVLAAAEGLWMPSPSFAVVACRVLRELIECDAVSFNRVLPAEALTNFVVDPPQWEAPLRAQRAVIEQLAHQHPIIDHSLRSGGTEPLRISDVADTGTWFSTELYRSGFRPIGIRWQMLLTLPSPGDAITVVALNKCTDDFSDRDVAVMRVLRPHLTLGSLTMVELAAHQEEATPGGWQVLTVDEARTVADATVGAPLAPGDRLPDEIDLRPHTGLGLPSTTVIWFDGVPWMVWGMGSGAAPWVLLAQRLSGTKARLAALTDRQREVLIEVAGGATNVEVARRLGIAPATVRKHLEAIYRALGAQNRVEAAALLVPSH